MKVIKVLIVAIILFSTGCTKETIDKNEEQKENIQDNEVVEENNELKYEKINVYLFWGNGCSVRVRIKNFFDQMDEEYKQYYNLVKYEVWDNEENRTLMRSVGKLLDENPTAVPYLIIGDVSIVGYNSGKDEYIKRIIKEQYNISSDKRVDLVKQVEELK